MKAPFRTASGGSLDRSTTLRFTFNGTRYTGHPGDTLASALLANGVHLVGRSFKYHRPRGILAARAEEPNALVTVGSGGHAEANARATMVELYDGLTARSQNAWPSLQWDLGAINNHLSRFFPAGFYYKTFLGSAATWTKRFEPFIRRMSGLGPAPTTPDPDGYTKRHAHCDLLVVGAGPAGLSAAALAAASGARVILIDENAAIGGTLRANRALIDGIDASAWAEATAEKIGAAPGCRVLNRTTAFGVYDNALLMAVERVSDHRGAGAVGPRQRLWQIRARHIIVTAGAHEQPLRFVNNDLPGIMLASAARLYLEQYGVLVGRRIVLAGQDQDTRDLLAAAGAHVTQMPEGALLCKAVGGKRVKAVILRDADGRTRKLKCDCLLMAGPWQAAVHLHSQAGGKVVYDGEAKAFLPAHGPAWLTSAGCCRTPLSTAQTLADGTAIAHRALNELGFTPASVPAPPCDDDRLCPVTSVPAEDGAKAFIDYQNDVTMADIDLACREGFVSVEHLKRYTTTGMATDQGKLSNVAALERMATRLGLEPGAVGTTTFRPPYTPVTLGALAAHDRGGLLDPVRETPMHGWHVEQGAEFENVGQWKRPWYYPLGGETMDEAVRRECRAVRERAGMLDASTLGKIDIQGPDAARFLERIYTNAWTKLETGRCRYGVMCREDGMVLDDGVTAHIADNRFITFTTTGNAARVLDHMEDYLQTEWPDLKVYLTSVTEHWAATVVTGPRSRDIVGSVVRDIDFDDDAFPHLSWRAGRIGGIPVRVYRISFTGEMSYEVHCPAPAGRAVWEALYEAGQPYGATAYGTEAMHVLRAEKGYIIIGQETDGTVSPIDLGLGWAIAKKKPDFIGKRSLARPDMTRPDRKQLVGLIPTDRATRLKEGAQIACEPMQKTPHPMLGHISSAYWSETLKSPFALALVKSGQQREGEEVYAHFDDRIVACRVTKPVFYDPSGEKLNG